MGDTGQGTGNSPTSVAPNITKTKTAKSPEVEAAEKLSPINKAIISPDGVAHPAMNKHVQNWEMSKAEGVQWIKDNTSLSQKEAEEAWKHIHRYSGSDFKNYHNEVPGYEKGIKAIDKALMDPKMPIYDGTLYRGVHFYKSGANGETPRQLVEQILKKGRWTEPGVTSFSTSRDTGEGFGGWSSAGSSYSKNSISVLVINKSNKSAVPIKHLSQHAPENEALVNSKVAKAGWDIASHKWVDANHLIIYIDE